VRAADSVHLWSATYDRPLDDIFKVQDEIADAIAQALQIRLAGGKLTRREGGTQNLRAYEFLQRGVAAFRPESPSSLEEAAQHFERAITLDPDFALARLWLGRTRSNQAYDGQIEFARGVDEARKQVTLALDISPDLAQAHAELGYIEHFSEFDWKAAQAAVSKALAIDPSDPWVLQYAGILAGTLGRWGEAVRLKREALIRDPLNPYAKFELAGVLYATGNFGEAERLFREELETHPGWDFPRRWLAKTLLATGDPVEALAIVRAETDDARRLAILPVVLSAAGLHDEADKAQNAQIARWSKDAPAWIAMSLAYRGKHDEAFEWLDRAYEAHDVILTTLLEEHLFSSIRSDPRYNAFLRKMNLPETPPG
jgi:tetratricopeptide (TPR) repeat protein